MIGYVKPYMKAMPRELKKEYRAIYCALCHTLNKINGLLGSACLNYEATLFLVILLAMQEDEPEIFHGSCSRSPLLHVPFVDYLSPVFLSAAYVSVVAAKLEVIDNLQDEGSFVWTIAERLLRRGSKRAENALKDVMADITLSIQKYNQLEREKCPDFDALLDASGKIFESMVAPLLAVAGVSHEAELTLLANALGKWIFLMDACDDYLKDMKQGTFNAVRILDSVSSIREIVSCTEDDIKSFVQDLPIRRYRELIRLLLIDNLKRVSSEILEKIDKEWYDGQV